MAPGARPRPVETTAAGGPDAADAPGTAATALEPDAAPDQQAPNQQAPNQAAFAALLGQTAPAAARAPGPGAQPPTGPDRHPAQADPVAAPSAAARVGPSTAAPVDRNAAAQAGPARTDVTPDTPVAASQAPTHTVATQPLPPPSIQTASIQTAPAAMPQPGPTLQQAPTPQAAPPQAPTLPQPAAQLAPAFLALSSSAHGGAAQQLVIRLDPIELGHVQIRIDRPADGPAHVVLAVERSDTMMMLMHDRPQLNLALDAAGVPSQGRTLQFDLSPGNGGGNSGGNQAGNQGNEQGDRRPGSTETPARPDTPPGRRPPAAWARTGVDITA